MKLTEEPEDKVKYYGLCALFVFFNIMSIWSLLKVYLSNPGYVTDYFKTVQIGGEPSMNRTNTPRVVADEENVQPIAVGQVSTKKYALYLKNECPQEECTNLNEDSVGLFKGSNTRLLSEPLLKLQIND